MLNSSSLSKARLVMALALITTVINIAFQFLGFSHLWLVGIGVVTVALNVLGHIFIGIAYQNLNKIKIFCMNLAKGDLEDRLRYPLEKTGYIEDVRLAINHFTDLTDAFLREAKYATDSTCCNHFYRGILTTGLHGSFIQTSEIINKANAASGQKNEAIGQLVKVIKEIVGTRKSNAIESAASSGIESIASAIEENSASIKEISRQVTESSHNTKVAEEKSSHLEDAARTLETSTGQIGQIISLINGIAEQTNLLALNATIEAARAGDAGKGFSVVANEVKKLANQTSEATQKIVNLMQNIDSAVDSTIGDVADMKDIIVRINETTTSIAATIEEQGYASSEIARSAGIISSGLHSINDRVDVITEITRKADPTKMQHARSDYAEAAE